LKRACETSENCILAELPAIFAVDDKHKQDALDIWYDLLYRERLITYGTTCLSPPSHHHVHLTQRGKTVLENFSKDPSNESGYLSSIAAIGVPDPIMEPYLREAVATFNLDQFRSAAVMLGCAT
jgi:hypothetical protein